MGLFSRLDQLRRRFTRLSRPSTTRIAPAPLTGRICRFEQMESRQYLSASPIQIGAVYYEDATQDDRLGDTIEITWSGGAAGTQLTSLVINTDKEGNGLSMGDCLFDTAPGGLGAFGSQPLVVVSQDGIDKVEYTVSDGGTRLEFKFTGFDAGERLIFTIDVDEMGFKEPNAVAEGNEWEGTLLTASFTAEHYADASGSDVFLDFYDAKLNASGLALPSDDYVPPGVDPAPVFTAGAVFSLEQTPLPITLSGTVFEDMNGNNVQESGDPGIAGVSLALYTLEGGKYVATALTTVTDAGGHYRFDDLEPGTYRVAETQPSGYLSIGARAGTVDGQTRGVVTDSDTLSGAILEGGDDSVRNDFAEARPASISGHVYADDNLNGIRDDGEALLAGVTLTLVDAKGIPTGATAVTDAKGYYLFSGLKPGTYGVFEAQPDGYYDGLDRAGTAGGAALNPGDSITGAVLTSGTSGLDYDFGEIRPASLSGHVYVDVNDNGVFDSGEAPLAGVTVHLLDAAGVRIATTTTAADGTYRFEDLEPGTYGVEEIQPAAYFDGKDSPGSVGGVLDGNDRIVKVKLDPGTDAKKYDFGELPPARISGYVYSDADNDGVFDSGEEPLAGVTVYLLDKAGARVATATTASDGSYAFENLEPGVYGVVEVQPDGYLDGKDSPGSVGGKLDGNDRVVDVTLAPGADAVHYDFGELVPASISGYVFLDNPVVTYEKGTTPPTEIELQQTRSGVRGSEDVSLEGVVLRLADALGVEVLDANGQPITTVTDANGYYEFNNLLPGIYTILQDPLSGYLAGVNTPGTKGGVAVNALAVSENPGITDGMAFDPSTEAIIEFTLRAGDRGEQYNFSELLLQEVTKPNPPPPYNPPSPPSPPTLQPPTQPYYPDALPPVYLAGPGMPIDGFTILYGGGGYETEYTWHLSVINAGRPRQDKDQDELLAAADNGYFSAVSWNGTELKGGEWILADGDGNTTRRIVFGIAGATPVAGDWNGDGTTEIGVFFDGVWCLDLNGDGRWSKEDLWGRLGQPGDLPVTGDWDGDGKSDIGIYGPAWAGDRRAMRIEPGLPDAKNHVVAGAPTRYKNVPPTPEQATSGWRTLKRTEQGKFRKDLIDHVFRYGDDKATPVTGDWNGDGVANIGIFYNGAWYLDVDGDGRWSAADVEISLGQAGDVPVVGDWNGDGRVKVGVFRSGTWLLDTNGDGVLDATDRVFRLGEAGDAPVVGDWNGDGIDEIGVYRASQPAPKQASTQSAPSAAPQSSEAVIKR